MWQVQKEEDFDIWISTVCTLKVQHFEEKCRVYIDYKGYNVAFPIGMWGFEEEVRERKIRAELEGEKGDFKSFCYVVNKQDLRLFCDLIFFFLSEHSLEGALNDAIKY